MRILVLSSAVPNDLMDEVYRIDKYPGVAADKHQWNIIKGIGAAAGHPVDLISSVPCTNYPGFPKALIGPSRWKHESQSDDFIIPFCNLPVLKHVTQFLSYFLAIVLWLHRNKSYSLRRVLVYQMHSPYVFASILATRLFGEKPILIVTDLPMGASKPKNSIKRIFKPFLAYLLIKSMPYHKGLIVLTRQMAQDFAPQVPFIVMEGIVSPDEHPDLTLTQSTEVSSNNNKIICYAGLLRKEYGVKLLLDAFALIVDDNYRLWIFGRGDDDMVSAVKSAAGRDQRIIYWGFRPNKEVLSKELESTVLVNPRPSDKKFTSYSFPSKLIEYMSIGRPVISAALPGIPAEYHDHIYILEDESPEGLARLLVSVCSKPPEELAMVGRQARNFVVSNKDYRSQGRRIFEFMKKL